MKFFRVKIGAAIILVILVWSIMFWVSSQRPPTGWFRYISAVPEQLFRLSEQHQDSRSFIGTQLIQLLRRAVRGGEAIAGPVQSRSSIYQEHVMMRSVPGNVMKCC